MEQYMSKTRENYGSGVTRPTINQDTPFKLKGQFLKELRDNNFSGSEHEDAKEHIEKVLEIADLFHIPKVTQDQIMLRAFPVSLTGAASRWLRNQPSGSITTWEVLKTKFLNKYCPPARTAKKIEEINNFQQEPDESLFRAWERIKELLMKCPLHYLTDMPEGVIPSKTVADAKVAIQEMAEYSQKWYNGTSSRTKSTETSNGLTSIQAQLNNLGREIKKVNKKVYATQVRCELCKGPHYTKDYPQKEEGKTLEEAYYTQFGASYQPRGKYRVAGPGFYQRNNGNSFYPDRRPSLEESLTKFMAESTKRHEEKSNIIKEIRASTDAAIRYQGALIKTLEIQIKKMSKVLQERGFGSLPSSIETNPRDQVKLISTAKADFSRIRRIGCDPYAVSGIQHRSILSETIPFPNRLQKFGDDNSREAQDEKILDAYDHTLPQKEKDPRSFTLPCFIHNICFDKALVNLGASVSVMPFSTYTNLDFIILDIPEDDDVLLILGRPFLSTAHSKIDVFKRKITLRVEEEKLIFKSIKPATSIIKRVFAIKSLDSKTELIGEGDEPFDPTYGSYIELNDLNTPLQPETNQDVDFEPTFVKTDSYKMKFSCVIGYKYVIADLLHSMPINLMSKSFYYSIIEDKDEGKSHAETLIDILVFVRSFSIISGFTIIDDDDMTKDVVLGMKFFKKYASYQMIIRNFAHEDEHVRIKNE
ncbi:ribonuclease H-like domain-containing protein [Tanacetum coccineum]